jgi:lysophospholipase L1-like esterase
MLRTRITGMLIGASLVLVTQGLGLAQSAVPGSPAASGPAFWSYVALGDSLLYALAEDCSGCTSAAVLYGDHITADTGVPVEVHNLTMHNGSTSSMLLGAISADAPIGRDAEHARTAIGGADIISVTIGYNDAISDALFASFTAGTCGGPDNVDCYLDTVPLLESNMDAILTEIDTLRAGRPTAVRVTNLYNNLIPEPGQAEPYGDPPGFGASVWKRFTETQNDAICRMAEQHGATCVDIYHAFNGPDGTASSFPLLGPDLTHPNQSGQETIAATLAAAGHAPLR